MIPLRLSAPLSILSLPLTQFRWSSRPSVNMSLVIRAAQAVYFLTSAPALASSGRSSARARAVWFPRTCGRADGVYSMQKDPDEILGDEWRIHGLRGTSDFTRAGRFSRERWQILSSTSKVQGATQFRINSCVTPFSPSTQENQFFQRNDPFLRGYPRQNVFRIHNFDADRLSMLHLTAHYFSPTPFTTTNTTHQPQTWSNRSFSLRSAPSPCHLNLRVFPTVSVTPSRLNPRRRIETMRLAAPSPTLTHIR